MIRIPVFFNNESTEQAKSMGVDIAVGKYDVRECSIYFINAIQPMFCKVSGVEYAIVYSSGIPFYTPWTKSKVELEYTKVFMSYN